MRTRPAGRPARALAGMGAALLTMVLVVAGAGAAHAHRAGVNVPAVPTPRDQIVVFVPHADDDVLSMGVVIEQALAEGKDVHVVYYTDGAGTGVCAVDVNGICQAHDQFFQWPVAQFIAARDSELYGSMAALGVPADHVELYAPAGQARRRDGTVDEPYAQQMLVHYHQQYPDATYLTMSWLDRHPDHRSAGQALRELVREHVIPADQALFSMARWYWSYAYPDRGAYLTGVAQQLRVDGGYPLATELLRCSTTDNCLPAIKNAVAAYRSTADGGTGYGIGYSSVPGYLNVTDNDPEVLLHGYDAARYPSTVNLASATRLPDAAVHATVRGQLGVPSFGQFDMNPDNPANSNELAQSLLGSLVRYPLPLGTPVTLEARDAAGRVLTKIVAPMASRGVFSGSLAIPAGAASITATTPGSTGLLPATIRWPVASQQVTLGKDAGLRISRYGVTGGYGRTVTVEVASSLARAPRRGVVVRMIDEGPDVTSPPLRYTGHTGADGTARFRLHLDHPATWRVVSGAAMPLSVAPAGTTIYTRVTPATLVVQPAHAAVHFAHGTGVLRGTVAGRDYTIPAQYLVPVTVRIWLTRPKHPAKLLATTLTRPGGGFSVAVRSHASGTLVYETSAVPGTYAAVARAGTATLRVG